MRTKGTKQTTVYLYLKDRIKQRKSVLILHIFVTLRDIFIFFSALYIPIRDRSLLMALKDDHHHRIPFHIISQQETTVENRKSGDPSAILSLIFSVWCSITETSAAFGYPVLMSQIMPFSSSSPTSQNYSASLGLVFRQFT